MITPNKHEITIYFTFTLRFKESYMRVTYFSWIYSIINYIEIKSGILHSGCPSPPNLTELTYNSEICSVLRAKSDEPSLPRFKVLPVTEIHNDSCNVEDEDALTNIFSLRTIPVETDLDWNKIS